MSHLFMHTVCVSICFHITYCQRSRTQWVCWHQTSLWRRPWSLSLQYQHPAERTNRAFTCSCFPHSKMNTHCSTEDSFNTQVNIWKYLMFGDSVSSGPVHDLWHDMTWHLLIHGRITIISLSIPLPLPAGRWLMLQGGLLVPSSSSSAFDETYLKNAPSCGTSSQSVRRIPSPQGLLGLASVCKDKHLAQTFSNLKLKVVYN